jgi:hypothetical protein
MKKTILLSAMAILFGLFTNSMAYGQKAEVEKKLQEYGIPNGFFEDNLKDENANHSFKIKTTTITDQETKVEEGTFDPTLPDGERWKLISVNGNEPSKKEIKQFHKAHNTSEDSDMGEPTDDDWKILDDNDSELIISFKYREENLPHKYKFLAKCTGKVFIDKNNKKLDRVEFNSNGPLKVKIFNVDKLEMTIKYQLEGESQTYLMEKENILMDARILGQTVEVKTISEFSDYKKVR